MSMHSTDDRAAQTRVLELLQKTAQDGPDPFRFCAFETAEAGVAHIAAHIDRCVLPQDALLRFSDGQVVTLEACNRRMVTLKHDQPPLTGVAGAICRGQNVLGPRAAQGVLLDLCAGRTSVEIHLLPDRPPLADASAGVPSQVIAPGGTGMIPLNARVTQFLNTMSSAVAGAFLWENNTLQALSGTPEQVAHLEEWAAPVLSRVLEDRFPLAASFETEGVYVFAGSEGGHGLLACELGVIFAAHIVGPAPSACLAAWRDLGA